MENSKQKIILSAAISIDGKISTKTGDSNLSSQKDFVRLHKLRSNVDAILIGKNTAIRDDPLLTVRHTKGKNPIRIVLDSTGTLPSKSKILQTSNSVPTIIAVSKKISTKNKKRLEKFPIDVMTVGEKKIKIKLLLKKLARKNINIILVEGGGTVNWEFVKKDLFDQIILTLSPFMIGGKNAISLLEGEGFRKISHSPNLKLKSVQRLKNHLVLTYVRV